MDDRMQEATLTTTDPGAGADADGTRRRRGKGRLVARGAALDYEHRVACSTIVREKDGLFGVLQVQGPSPETARRGLEALREAIEGISNGPQPGAILREAIVAASGLLRDLNARLRKELGIEEKKLLRGQVTLLARQDGGFAAAYVGSQRVIVIRRGRMVGSVVRPQEIVEAGQILVREFLGVESNPDVAQADVQVEGGDLVVIANSPIVQVEDALGALERASRGDGLQELANNIGAFVTIPVPGPLPAPEIGHASGLAWAALSSTGMRVRNEDAYRIDGESGVFVVADGLGGHDDGALASRLGVDTLAEVYAAEGSWVSPDDTAGRACELAGARISRRTADGGTTIEAVRVKDGVAHIAHIGDSRVYLYRQERLVQLTKDHSWVAERVEAGSMTPEQARTHPQRNIVTKALGRKFDPPDVIEQELREGDMLLLCSDGLTGSVEDDTVARTLRTSRSNLARAAEMLVEVAYDGGASDNLTVVLVARLAIGSITSRRGVPRRKKVREALSSSPQPCAPAKRPGRAS